MTGIRNNYVEVFKKFAQNTRQRTVIRNSVKKSKQPISFSVSFCICERLFKLISFSFVWERETLGAVHSTHDYGFWSNYPVLNLDFPLIADFYLYSLVNGGLGSGSTT